jgi:response regulator NasT
MSGEALARVLTVEDNPIVRADLRLVLEDAGFAVCADARDGVEAIELAREHEPDVILLDLGLPRLDGVEAARRIRRERDVPIVALTGHRDGPLREGALEAGASSCVLKPFLGAEIVGALWDALAMHQESVANAARLESRRTLAAILGAIGYPEEWVDVLEQRCYEAGVVWRWTK